MALWWNPRDSLKVGVIPSIYSHNLVKICDVGGILEIFLFILVAGLVAHFIGAGIHEGIFVGALVRIHLLAFLYLFFAKFLHGYYEECAI